MTKIIKIKRREKIASSIIKDTYSFIILGFFFWFNYNFIGGSYLVNFLVLLCCFTRICKDEDRTSYRVSDQKFQQIQSILENEKNN